MGESAHLRGQFELRSQPNALDSPIAIVAAVVAAAFTVLFVVGFVPTGTPVVEAFAGLF